MSDNGINIGSIDLNKIRLSGPLNNGDIELDDGTVLREENGRWIKLRDKNEGNERNDREQ